MNVEHRIIAALKVQPDKSAWERLMSLFRADREAFYVLACEGVSNQAEPWIRELANLAASVRAVIHEPYEIEQFSGSSRLISSSGRTIVIPSDLVRVVSGFLREIDGKTTGPVAGKDYEGTAITEAEARFKLGDEDTWDKHREELQAERRVRPFVLRIGPEDAAHLKKEPPYVTHELLQCARRTILAPTAVFRGLKRGDDSNAKVDEGWSFCGKPTEAYGNDGNAFPAPEGMVFLVYADDEGFVFDWDWVQESPDEPGYPLDWQLRFGRPVEVKRESVLDLPRDLQLGHFDASQASYSRRGDCIFCYLTDDVSSACRINSDLTVFKALGREDVSGFKVKNVRRILQKDKSIVLDDAPELTVFVDSVLLASLRQQKDDLNARVDMYSVVIRALHRRIPEPPKVTVPREPNESQGVVLVSP